MIRAERQRRVNDCGGAPSRDDGNQLRFSRLGRSACHGAVSGEYPAIAEAQPPLTNLVKSARLAR